ncbi:acyltransferase family protein [Bacillus sp. FJAT-47783]|uniref:acyltransferase family protein n=1 Tax=Bacillus sp. FJAT-47783 TaxID=2922712 RepID=UPI001FAC0D1F|nr:acyltransferase family protein [Bacillus sp. FJAT-47783]
MLEKQKQNHRYVYGLDGLRAIAVLSVIAYHFNFYWAKGGFLGVDIFFILSGYLITSILLSSFENKQKINLREFWMKRFRRLLPAAYVMIIVTVVWVILFKQELLTTIRGDALSSLFYISNWWFIFHEVSYFDSFGSPSPLKNLWSLAIEEQFYIIWPLVLTVGLFICKKRFKFSIVIFIGALCSALLMGLFYEPGGDPSRVYYGTDTRSFCLLLGCCLALVWPMNRLSSKKLPSHMEKMLNVTTMITFSIFIVCVVFIDQYQTFLYRGGLLLICLNSTVLVACVSHPSSLLGRMLSFKPLRWIGTRSYGIYLWHYPVIVLSTPVQEIGSPVYWRVFLQLSVTLVIAEWSYRYVEMPIRKNGFKPFVQKYLLNALLNWKKLTIPKRVLTTITFLMLLVFNFGMAGLVEEKKANSPVTEIKISSKEKTSVLKDSPSNEESNKVSNEDKGKEHDSETDQESTMNTNNSFEKILAIGDSVMLDIGTKLQDIHPDITIDGKVGRQVRQAVQLAPSYASFNHSDNAVIIELGTNGYFTNSQIDTLLSSFSKAQIYLVNTRVPRPWEKKVNRALEQKAEENENVTLIDWYSQAINHPEYFGRDGVHLTPAGIEALTSLIKKSITK